MHVDVYLYENIYIYIYISDHGSFPICRCFNERMRMFLGGIMRIFHVNVALRAFSLVISCCLPLAQCGKILQQMRNIEHDFGEEFHEVYRIVSECV